MSTSDRKRNCNPGNSEPKRGCIGSITSPHGRPSGAERMAKHDRSVTASMPSVADTTGRRIYIENIYPLVDAGRFPVKRIAGEAVEV